MLGANPRTGIQGRIAHIAQVVMKPFSQCTLQALEIILMPVGAEVAEPVVDEFVMVKVGAKLLFPLHIALKEIQLQRRSLPDFVIGRLRQHLAEFPDTVINHLVNLRCSSRFDASEILEHQILIVIAGKWIVYGSAIIDQVSPPLQVRVSHERIAVT